jgi:hypothetical protein
MDTTKILEIIKNKNFRNNQNYTLSKNLINKVKLSMNTKEN